jgi:hypothetical protein
MSDHRKRPRDFSQAATLDFKRDHSILRGSREGQNRSVPAINAKLLLQSGLGRCLFAGILITETGEYKNHEYGHK